MYEESSEFNKYTISRPRDRDTVWVSYSGIALDCKKTCLYSAWT